MKQILIVVMVTVSYFNHAQLRNGGFENWSTILTHGYHTEMADSHYAFNLPAGLYLARLQTEQGEVIRRLEVRWAGANIRRLNFNRASR
jgi:hypothetical protein